MNFNSPIFFFFLIVVVAANYFLSQRYRSAFLLFTSLLFIAYYNVDSLIAVLFFSFFNFYFAKIIIENRKAYIVGVLVNSFAIIVFNYLSSSHKELNFYFSGICFNIESLIIAIGLSFYSLQNIAYLTEIYFKRSIPESSFLKYLLYVSFFSKILCGPVMLPNEFIPQINTNVITHEKLISGFNRLLLGLFKKMVIADRLSPAVHSIFDHSDNYPGFTTLIGVYLFTIQLYFDFSGYTDMALGIAKMLGYDLKENFNVPFRSTSVSEFWRRWHISLISWFTNYIYYPLVYRLRTYKKASVLTGILITFLISGIWHGIGFTFLAWAGCHVIYLCIEFLTKHPRIHLSERFNNYFFKMFTVFIVFNAICFSNIFFRSESMGKAFQLIENIFSNFIPQDWLFEFINPLVLGGNQMDVFNFFISIFIIFLVLLFERKINRVAISEKFSTWFVVICILSIMLFGVFNSGAQFIYMQF